MNDKKHFYMVNEIYRSPQGEGIRQGEDSIFVRFTGCNMRCSIEPGPLSPGGFDCDTEFESGRKLCAIEIMEQCVLLTTEQDECKWIVFTGGEPGLQLDEQLLDACKHLGFKTQIETNGSIALPPGIDCISVSPKVAEHCIRQKVATEVKYVRGYGQALPKTVVEAEHYWISPAFNGLVVERDTIDWCNKIIKDTKWKISLQKHKLLGVR